MYVLCVCDLIYLESYFFVDLTVSILDAPHGSHGRSRGGQVS